MTRTLEEWRYDAPGAWIRHLRTRSSASLLEQKRDRVVADHVRLKEVESRVGVAFFPLVLNHPDFHGFLLRVEARPLAIGEPVHPELVNRAHRWLAALAGLENLGTWENVPVVVADRPEGVVLSGDSLGLAAVAAVMSAILGEAPRTPVITSAILGAPGPVPRVMAVDGQAEKRDIVSVEAPFGRLCVAQTEGEVSEWLCEWFGADWQGRLVKALGASPQADALDALSAFRQRNFAVAKQRAELALRAGARGHAEAVAEWVAAAVQLNQAEAAAALVGLERARARMVGPPEPHDLELDGYEVLELEAFLGIALVDQGRPSMAVDRLRGALDRLLVTEQRNRSWKSAALQLSGSLHRAYVFSDRGEEAASLLDWSLTHAALSEERARCLGDFAEVCRRLGDIVGASQHLRSASEWLARAEAAHRPATARFLRLFGVRSGLERADFAVVPPDWSRWPQPAEVLEQVFLDRAAFEAWGTKHIRADTVTFVQGLVYVVAAARAMAAGHAPPSWFAPVVQRLMEERGIELEVREMLARALAGDVAMLVRCAPY